MTNNLTPRPEVRGAIVGVDTHKHIHVAVAIDTCGIHLGDQSFAADSGGDQALLTWAETHGRIQAFGIEGTGGYGVGLARAGPPSGASCCGSEVERTGACAASPASPTGSTPRPPPDRCWRAKRPRRQRPRMVPSR